MNDPIRIGSRKCKECGKRGQCYKRPDHDEQLCRGCLPVQIPENRGKHRNRATQTAALLKHRNSDMTAARKSRSMGHRIVRGQSIKKVEKAKPKFDRSLFQPISPFRNHITRKSGMCPACSERKSIQRDAVLINPATIRDNAVQIICRSCAEGQ